MAAATTSKPEFATKGMIKELLSEGTIEGARTLDEVRDLAYRLFREKMQLHENDLRGLAAVANRRGVTVAALKQQLGDQIVEELHDLLQQQVATGFSGVHSPLFGELSSRPNLAN